MNEQAAVVESSTTEVVPPQEAPVMDVARGPLVDITADQRAEFRKTGKLPEMPKKEDSAPSSEAKPEKVEAETAGESDPPEIKQERTERKPKPTAEERIAQLESTIERIRKDAGLNKPKADSAPAKPESVQQPKQPQNYEEWSKTFNGKAWREKYAAEHPEAEFEDVMDAQADYKNGIRRQFDMIEQQRREQSRELNSKLNEARDRYENFDEARTSFAEAISKPDFHDVVRVMLNESEYLPDLAAVIGGSKDDLAAFEKMGKDDPGKAIRYVALTESLIADRLSKKDDAKAEEVPAKPKTNAPKPPSEAGGRAAAPPDGLESAAKANDFRAFKAEANRRALAKLKG